jgi:hypothetical protein
MGQVVIGMDPHKRSATIEVMAGDETILGGGRVPTGVWHVNGTRRVLTTDKGAAPAWESAPFGLLRMVILTGSG